MRDEFWLDENTQDEFAAFNDFIRGDRGPAGPAGADGADGKSAYQQAVEGGFAGTESEFNAYLGEIGDLTEDVDDLKIASNNLAAGLDTKAPAIYNTASGAVASFDDGADGMPLKALTVNIEPVQAGSGDPSPDNVRPITGWTGAKVFYPGLDITLDLDIVKNKYISTSGVEADAASTDISHTDFFPVTPGATLYLSTYWDELPDSALSIAFYDVNKTFQTPRKYFFSDSVHRGAIGYNFATVTVPSNCYYAILNFSYRVRNRIVLTDKDPTITFPAEAGTVYGGTLDVVNRKLYSYPYYSSYNSETLVGPWLSSMDVYTPGATPTLDAQVVDMGGTATSYDLSDVPEITTLLGENNIWVDCGDVTVEYPADTKLYIDAQTKATRNLIAGIETSMTASKAYSAGDLLIVGDTLYKAATSIASGATLTPGTNVNATTVSGQIIYLVSKPAVLG